ncbi:pdz/dhr/glgf [Niveomyces insectorum RCEF 264]|uniref:Pdz/dhr/glgf n=1 Tax=Niveomyces insectorum RCEF 264 TaxID=1081102 RepID=A0A167W759_9HYPO|nr:pdz/dhr/glgf [Niveomyces insectorum RCEF 264]
MASPTLPQLTLHLAPRFDSTGAATGLAVCLEIAGVDVAEGARLLGSNTLSVRVRDDRGTVDFIAANGVDSPVRRVSRATQGRVVLEIDVQIRPDAAIVENGAELRLDQGGIIGSGQGFLPQLALPSGPYQIAVKWDLSNAPAGTKAACTIGDGPEPPPIAGSFDKLVDAVYAVGPLHHFPEDVSATTTSTDNNTLEGVCRAYWLGSLPANLAAVKDFNYKMFPALKNFFQDDEGSYRLFLRKVPNGFNGLTLGRSGLVDYDDHTPSDPDWDLVRLLNHHMVRSWVQLDLEEDGSENDWFSIGLSELYSIYFPFRFKQRTPDYFRYTLNGFLTGYFTNPLIGSPLAEVANMVEAGDPHAPFVLPMRACMYMMRMDVYMRRASKEQGAGVARPIDEIVRDIAARRRRGETVRTQDWLAHVGRWLGTDAAAAQFKEFVDGEIMRLADMERVFDGLYPTLSERLDFGFVQKRDGNGNTVLRVTPGSRAAGAGLQNGDIVTNFVRPRRAVTNGESKQSITVERNGARVEIVYWPRSETKVEAWVSRKKDEAS